MWTGGGTVGEKWSLIKSVLCETAPTVLGTVNKSISTGLYRENEAILKPLFKKRNNLYTKWLSTG